LASVPKSVPFRHLAHAVSFREQPIVFFTVVTYGRQAILATDMAQEVLHGI
jgi:hypothetical protein